MTPMLHMSMALVYWLRWMISGAMYAGVPQMVWLAMEAVPWRRSKSARAIPKSAILHEARSSSCSRRRFSS